MYEKSFSLVSGLSSFFAERPMSEAAHVFAGVNWSGSVLMKKQCAKRLNKRQHGALIADRSPSSAACRKPMVTALSSWRSLPVVNLSPQQNQRQLQKVMIQPLSLRRKAPAGLLLSPGVCRTCMGSTCQGNCGSCQPPGCQLVASRRAVAMVSSSHLCCCPSGKGRAGSRAWLSCRPALQPRPCLATTSLLAMRLRHLQVGIVPIAQHWHRYLSNGDHLWGIFNWLHRHPTTMQFL